MDFNAPEEMERLRQENLQLRTEGVTLKDEIGLLESKLRRSEAEVRILKKRPASFDPLAAPVVHLPIELQEAVQAKALKLDGVVTTEELLPFFRVRPDTIVNSIEMPHHRRMQHIKAFLKVNTIHVNLLPVLSKPAPEVLQEMRGLLKLTDSDRAVHIDFSSENPFVKNKKAEAFTMASHAILKDCTNLQHVSIQLFIDPAFIEFQHVRTSRSVMAGSASAADSGEPDYASLLVLPPSVKTVHITAKLGVPRKAPRDDEQRECTKAWLASTVSAIKAAISKDEPGREITKDYSPLMARWM